MRLRVAIAMAMSVESLLATPSLARAVSLETLVMPGAVATAHVAIEKDCRKCHEPFRQQSERGLCLDCHDDVRADVENGRGFHGRSAAVHAECRSCHTEHAGRRADIVRLNRDTFDHDATDFALTGAHARVACKQCHPEGQKFRDSSASCNGCHAEDDPHGGSLGPECSHCHVTLSWMHVRFDHDMTGFRLLGAHSKTPCASCHPDRQFEGAPSACGDCHRIDDVHGGRRGSKCGDCHGVERWDRTVFDHAARTGFPLRGKHAALACESCHSGTNLSDPLPHDCQGCHRQDDAHRGQLGTRCESCHEESAWRSAVRFDHDTGRFPLVGLHGLVPCEQCHLTSAYQDAPTACVACHEKHDVHARALGENCMTCHNPAGWAMWRFDHDRSTRFPLDGAHEELACGGCHARPLSDPSAVATDCVSCHRRDDVHRGAYGLDCARCHSTATFEERTGIP